MKQLILSALVLMFAVSSYAQSSVQQAKSKTTKERVQKTAEERTQALVAKMTEACNLTTTQQAEVYQISLDANNRMDALRAKKDQMDRDEIKEERARIRKNANKQMKQVLDKDQKAQYKALKKEMKGKRKNKRNKRRNKAE